MSLKAKIEDWKNYPNALGSESQAAVILGEIAAKTGNDIPEDIRAALKVLSLRGTIRDIASAFQQHDHFHLEPTHMPKIDVADLAAISCGLSWAESLVVITRYFEEQSQIIGQIE
jgi:hypothetical protein